MKEAGIARKALVKVRTGVLEKHKQLKADSLKYGRLLDGIKNILIELNLPTEAYLREQEEFAENAKIKEKAKLKESRLVLLAPFEVDTTFYDLENMSDLLFNKLLEDSVLLFNARKEKAEKEAADAKALEEKEAEEKRQREQAIQIENDRLKKEHEEREKIRLEMEQLQEKRFNELIKYTNANTDSVSVNMAKLWEETEEQFQTILLNRKARFEKLEKEKIEAEAENKRKSEEAEKQRQALQKAAEERLNERKKALFALGFAESNGKMVFDTYILDLQVITSLDSNSWGKELDIATGHVSKRKIEIEAQRIANEKAEAEELEAAKGDKEKFQNLAFELESLKKKYSNFKSKKHQKLSTEVNGLIQKIQDYINLKN